MASFTSLKTDGVFASVLCYHEEVSNFRIIKVFLELFWKEKLNRFIWLSFSLRLLLFTHFFCKILNIFFCFSVSLKARFTAHLVTPRTHAHIHTQHVRLRRLLYLKVTMVKGVIKFRHITNLFSGYKTYTIWTES